MVKRVVIAGSRNFDNYQLAKEFIDSCLEELLPTHTIIIVSGTCRGADTMGERYAQEKGLTIEEHPARWDKYGRAAGPKRNKEMVEISDMIICFWDGKSKGTASLIKYAQKQSKDIKIKEI